MIPYIAPNLMPDKHAFFGRKGGVSKGFFESLNFNFRSSDKPENITENLRRVAEYYNQPAKNMVRLYQDHTNVAVFIEKPSLYEVHADVMVTNKKGLILGITTADCVPILFADYKHGIIGAAHGGWRGVLYGVVENTIEVMLNHGAKLEDIRVATGPCLQKSNFEVRNDMRSQFIEYDNEMSKFFEAKADTDEKYLCDLEEIIKYRLQKIGITDIFLSGIDTYGSPMEYFSYRRFCHESLIKTPGDFPIQLSTITL